MRKIENDHECFLIGKFEDCITYGEGLKNSRESDNLSEYEIVRTKYGKFGITKLDENRSKETLLLPSVLEGSDEI